MVFGFHFFWGNNPFDDTFFIDDEGCTERSHVFSSIHAFLSPYTEFLYQFLFCISNQSKRKIVLFYKFLV